MHQGSTKDCEVYCGYGRRRVRGVVWIWSAKSGRCSVDMFGEECEVGETLVVVASVTWSVQW